MEDFPYHAEAVLWESDVELDKRVPRTLDAAFAIPIRIWFSGGNMLWGEAEE